MNAGKDPSFLLVDSAVYDKYLKVRYLKQHLPEISRNMWVDAKKAYLIAAESLYIGFISNLIIKSELLKKVDINFIVKQPRKSWWAQVYLFWTSIANTNGVILKEVCIRQRFGNLGFSNTAFDVLIESNYWTNDLLAKTYPDAPVLIRKHMFQDYLLATLIVKAGKFKGRNYYFEYIKKSRLKIEQKLVIKILLNLPSEISEIILKLRGWI